MENKKAEGLSEISFFLGILFFVLSMFAIPFMEKPGNLWLMLIFLLIFVGNMIICIVLAVNQRAVRDNNNKSGKSRVVPYL